MIERMYLSEFFLFMPTFRSDGEHKKTPFRQAKRSATTFIEPYSHHQAQPPAR